MGVGVGVGGGQDVGAGGVDVGDASGFDLGGPQRKAIRGEQGLDIAAEVGGLSRVFAFHAGRLEAAPVGVEDLSVHDEVRQPFGGGLLEGVVQVGGLAGEDVDGLMEVAVAGEMPNALPCRVRWAVAGSRRSRRSPGPSRSVLWCPSWCRGPAFLAKQAGDVADEVTRDVEHGRIDDQRGALR